MGKVSIIVPVFNTEDYLAACIESIIKQTYTNIELILINDGSTDNSFNIIQKYKNKDSRILVESIKNSGVSTARNLGLELASGEYVMFVDSDDWIEEYTVELAVKNIQENDSDIVIWSYFKNYPQKELSLSLLPTENRSFKTEEDKELLYLKSIYANYRRKSIEEVSAGTVMCKLYKMDLLIRGKAKFNPNLIRAEDVIFGLNAFKNANKISYLDKNLYHYRINESSICNSFRFIEDTQTPFNLLIEELNSFYLETKGLQKVKTMIDCRIIQVLLWHLKYNYYNKGKKENVFRRKKQINKLINSEPYKTAIKNIDLKLIPKQERLMVILFRKKLIILYYIIQKLITIKNNNKSQKFK